jgi:phage tail sheath protein FI
MRDAFITDYAADKVRDYGMAIYLMDMPSWGSVEGSAVRIFDNDAYDPDTTETLGKFSGRSFDNNYVATYYPDVKIYDEYTDAILEAPASIAAMAAISYTDKVAYPWFAPAGFNRASLDVVKGTTVRLNTADRDNLYEARINPIATFPNAGYVIFGQKTLQMMASSLDRVNVRRMLLEVKRQVVSVAKNMLFEQNNATTRAKFAAQLKPKLSLIQTQQGIDMYSITVDDSNNTPSDIESNKMNGRVVLVPTRAIEYVAIDFIVTSSGVSFE